MPSLEWLGQRSGGFESHSEDKSHMSKKLLSLTFTLSIAVSLFGQSSPIVRFNSLGQLQAFVPSTIAPSTYLSAFVAGSVSNYDNGGGLFTWVAGAGDPTNATTIIASPYGAVSGRWFLNKSYVTATNGLATRLSLLDIKTNILATSSSGQILAVTIGTNLLWDGNAISATTTSPSGPAGGVLSGTYPNPNLAADLILTNFTYKGGNFSSQTNTDVKTNILATDISGKIISVAVGTNLNWDGTTLIGSVGQSAGTGSSMSKLFYVSTTGSDVTGKGSFDKPFATVQKSINQIVANNDNSTNPYVIYVMPGSYGETLDFGFTNLFNLSIKSMGGSPTGADGDLGQVTETGINTTNNAINANSLHIEGLHFTGNVTFIQTQLRGDSFEAFKSGLDFYRCWISGNATFSGTQFGSFYNASEIDGSLIFTNVTEPVIEFSQATSGGSLTIVSDGSLVTKVECDAFIKASTIGNFVLSSINSGNPSTLQALVGTRIGAPGGAANTVGTNCTFYSRGSVLRNALTNNGSIAYAGEFYNPTTSTNWSGTVPANIGAALDNISASRVINTNGTASGLSLLDVKTNILAVDSAGKIKALTLGTNLTFDGTTLSSTGGGATWTADNTQFVTNSSIFSIKNTPVVTNLTEKANLTIFGGSGAFESVGTSSSGTLEQWGNTTLYGSPAIFHQIVRNGFGGGMWWYEDSTPLFGYQSSAFKVVDSAGAGQAIFEVDQSSKNIGAGDNGLTTSSTSGFFGIPSMAGKPTGTPSNFSFGANYVPICVDRTGGQIYFWDKSSLTWKSAAGVQTIVVTEPSSVVSVFSPNDLLWSISDSVDAVSGRISGLQSLNTSAIMALDQRLNLSTNGFTLIVSAGTETNNASAWADPTAKVMLLATDMDNPQHEGELQMFIKNTTNYLEIYRTNNLGNLVTNETTIGNFAADPGGSIPYAAGSIGHWQITLDPAITNLSVLENGVWKFSKTYNDIAPSRALTGVGVGTTTNFPVIGKVSGDNNGNNVVIFKWNLFNYARATNASGVIGEDYGLEKDAGTWADFGSGTNGATIKFDMNSVDSTIVNSIPNTGPPNYNLQFTNQYTASNLILPVNPHGMGYYKDLRAGNLTVRTNATIAGIATISNQLRANGGFVGAVFDMSGGAHTLSTNDFFILAGTSQTLTLDSIANFPQGYMAIYEVAGSAQTLTIQPQAGDHIFGHGNGVAVTSLSGKGGRIINLGGVWYIDTSTDL